MFTVYMNPAGWNKPRGPPAKSLDVDIMHIVRCILLYSYYYYYNIT